MPVDDDLELDTSPKKDKSGIKKIIIIAAAAVTFIALTVFATLYFTGAFSHKGGEDTAEMEQTGDKEEAKQKKKTEKKKDKGVVIYHLFEPAFVVNFEDNNVVRFLQVGMSVMTHDSAVVEELKKHEPAIRNDIVLLFSSQTYADLSSREGKEALRKKALIAIQNILKENTGDTGIEQVYFTSFVIQ